MAYSKSNYKEKKINEITQQLTDTLDSFMTSDEKYLTFLNTISKFPSYSLNNILLISNQKPGATNVAGYKKWQNDFNRQVKKGAKSIKIIAPVIRKEWVEAKDSEGKLVYNNNGQVKKTKQNVVKGYRAVSVFDIADTTGKPLTTAKDLINESLKESNDFKDLYNEFKEHLNTNELPITETDILSDEILANGAKGYYHSKEHYIVLDTDRSYDEKFKTLIHEYAHSKLHRFNENDLPKDVSPSVLKAIKEIEAESTAYIVCKYYGLDTSDYSIGYMGGYATSLDENTIKQHIKNVKENATETINEINDLPNFSKFIEQKMNVEHIQEMYNKLDKMIDTNLKNGFDKITIIEGNLLEKYNFKELNDNIYENDDFVVKISNKDFNVNNYKDTCTVELISKIDETLNKEYNFEQTYEKNLINNTCKIFVKDLSNTEKTYHHTRDIEGNILTKNVQLSDDDEIVSFEKFINDSLKNNGIMQTLDKTVGNGTSMGYQLDVDIDDLGGTNFKMIKANSYITAKVEFDNNNNAFAEFKIKNTSGIKLIAHQESAEQFDTFSQRDTEQQKTDTLEQ